MDAGGDSSSLQSVQCATELAPTPGNPLNEWCPQCPVLTALLSPGGSACGVFHGVHPAHVWSPLFPLPLCSRHYCLSQRTCLLTCLTASVCHSAQEVSGFICSETHLFAPFAVPGLCRALLHHVNEPVSHQPLPCLALTSARGDWEDEGWTASALVSVARLCSWWPFLIFHCCPSDLLVSWLLPALEPRVGPRSARALPISVSSLWMLKLCISSAARIYLPVGQMQSCFASFLLHCHQKSLQIIATFCLSGGVTCRA